MTGALPSRYALDEPLGAGSVGTVYRVHQENGGSPLAIKVLDPEFAANPDVLERLAKDKTLLRSLRSPYLVTVEDTVSEPNIVGIVMELVTGGTLRDYVALQGKLPAVVALSITQQLLAGLAIVHRRGLTHGRLTPQDVLLHGSATDAPVAIKVSDFGMLRLLAGTSASSSSTDSPYSAPEVAAGELATPASDLYSVGVVLHELLAGQLPAKAAGEQPSTGRGRRKPPVQAFARPEQISPAIWGVLIAWLNPNPAKRPANTWTALTATEGLLDALLTASPAEVPVAAGEAVAAEVAVTPSEDMPEVAPAKKARKTQRVKKVAASPKNTLIKATSPVLVTAGAGGPDVLEASPDILEVIPDTASTKPDILKVIPSYPMIVSVVEGAALAPAVQPPVVDEPPIGPPPGDEPPSFAPSDLPKEEPRLRRWGHSRYFDAAAIGAVLLLIGGSLYGLAPGGGGTKTFSYNFTTEDIPQSGIEVSRTWIVTGGDHPTLHADVEFRASKQASTTVDELLPTSLLTAASTVSFNPSPEHVDGNHVVRYSFKVNGGQVIDASYDISLQSRLVSQDVLNKWAYQQEQESGELYRNSHPLASLRIKKSFTLTVGLTANLNLSGELGDGTPAPSVALGGAKYRVDNARIATVTSDGRLTAKKPGKTTVHATLGDLTVSSSVIVKAATKKVATTTIANNKITNDKITNTDPTLPTENIPSGNGNSGSDTVSSSDFNSASAVPSGTGGTSGSTGSGRKSSPATTPTTSATPTTRATPAASQPMTTPTTPATTPPKTTPNIPTTTHTKPATGPTRPTGGTTIPPLTIPTNPPFQPPKTAPPVYTPPVNTPPNYTPPATEPPATTPPVTTPPVTQAPVTQAPVAEAPVTEAPVTRAPSTTPVTPPVVLPSFFFPV